MTRERCPFTDAVLARHLDGDVTAGVPHVAEAEFAAAAALWPADAIAEHLADCAPCQRSLARARRLDAALAEQNGREAAASRDDADHLDRLLHAAIARATPPPPAAAPVAAAAAARGRSPTLVVARLAAAASLLALGYASACWWRADAEAPTGGREVSSEGEVLSGSEVPERRGIGDEEPRAGGADRDGAARATRAATAPDAAPPDAAAALAAVDGGPDPAPPTWIPVFDQRRPSPPVAAAPADAANAGAAAESDPFAERVAAIARLDAGPELAAALETAREEPAFAERVRGLLASRSRRDAPRLSLLTAVAAAARIGGRRLDAELRALCRRHDGLEDAIAAALRAPVDRPGRAALLLDVFGDRVARGAADDDEDAIARRLFAGQPGATYAELIDELAQSRHAERRIRCLLALGALRDARALDALRQRVHGPVLAEAIAAAFAIAQLPPQHLERLEPEAEHGPEAWLLRAALCCAATPRASRWIRELELTESERELVGRGRFTFVQFPVFAAMLRERSAGAF